MVQITDLLTSYVISNVIFKVSSVPKTIKNLQGLDFPRGILPFTTSVIFTEFTGNYR